MGDDLVGIDEAAELLGVPAEQVTVLADQGVLTRLNRLETDEEGPIFARSEVLAARLLGG